MSNFSIVIPAADTAKDSTILLDNLITSIDSHKLHERYPIYICYDACKDSFIEYFQLKYPFINPILNNGNRLNFARNSNNGLRKAHSEGHGAIVVNQDCILPSVSYFKELERKGVCSPTQACLTEAIEPINSEWLTNLEKEQPDSLTHTEHNKVTGFCMSISKELMDTVGYFIESYYSTFEDDHMCAAALISGFPVEQSSIKVHHYISKCGSYTDKNAYLLQDAHLKFRKFWSIPRDPNIVHAPSKEEHKQYNQWIKENHVWIPEMKAQ